jgi:hypothetical protein
VALFWSPARCFGVLVRSAPGPWSWRAEVERTSRVWEERRRGGGPALGLAVSTQIPSMTAHPALWQSCWKPHVAITLRPFTCCRIP